MGFMDKTKKMAEQTQQKLGEVQERFRGQQGGQQPEKPVRHDEPGRPIEEGPPAGEAPPPPAEPPAADRPPPLAQERSTQGAPDSNPDPSKSIE